VGPKNFLLKRSALRWFRKEVESRGMEPRTLTETKLWGHLTQLLIFGNEEFDRRFDQGEDIHQLIDLSKTEITKPGKKVRITLDVSQSLVKEIDKIREAIGVDRGALIKVWLYDKVRQDKAERRQ
jgi:hypothetical protein